jgi:hypothetical protein
VVCCVLSTNEYVFAVIVFDVIAFAVIVFAIVFVVNVFVIIVFAVIVFAVIAFCTVNEPAIFALPAEKLFIIWRFVVEEL